MRKKKIERSEAVVEWEARGQLGGEQQSLLTILRARFGEAIPADLEAAVATLTADERLHWVKTAATAPSLEAFRTLVGRPASSS
jgi:hypothetical protein